MELNVINISEFVGKDCDEDLHMTKEEREEKEINWKYIWNHICINITRRSMTAQLCTHYAAILKKEYEYNDSINHTLQYLLIHGISLYNV